MSLSSRLATFVALLAVTFIGSQAAEACGWGNNYGYGIGGLYRSLDYPTESRVPYFAAHPPVYYSQPVPRTYGHSPFAYGPWHKTPEIIESATPVVIENPHAKEASQTENKQAKKSSRVDRSVSIAADKVSGPLMIENPYFNEVH